jgi:hypothetical protein
MILKYSPKGIPYIEIDEQTRIMFAHTGGSKLYYKWLAVKGYDVLNGMVGKGRRRREFVRTTAVNFITDFKLREFPKGWTKRHPTFSDVKKGYLKRIFSKLCVIKEDDDYPLFPVDKLWELEARLDKLYGDSNE